MSRIFVFVPWSVSVKSGFCFALTDVTMKPLAQLRRQQILDQFLMPIRGGVKVNCFAEPSITIGFGRRHLIGLLQFHDRHQGCIQHVKMRFYGPN